MRKETCAARLLKYLFTLSREERVGCVLWVLRVYAWAWVCVGVCVGVAWACVRERGGKKDDRVPECQRFRVFVFYFLFV